MTNTMPVVELHVRILNPEATTAVPSRTVLKLTGRVAFACDELLRAGAWGLTAIERPAYRWSDYVFKLRKVGIVVQTVHEPHGGPFSGRHARYVLQTPIQVVKVVRAGETHDAA